ncbi:MAG: MBL fold metallo-hydrolase [Myxococcales bacterium]|nr:MBL fold metallo-hydrolase [Myxococcales bacterium]
MIFRQLFHPDTSTYTYLLGDERTREAVLIDPVRDMIERDLQLVGEMGLKLKYTLETHVHADHVTSSGLLRQRTGALYVASADGGADCADVPVSDGDAIIFGQYALEARLTPGHTNTCVSYVLSDESRVFTGDTLLIRGCGRTDFQQGDPRKLYRSVQDKLFSLPDECLVYPGHDYKGRTCSSIAEEKRFNLRLGDGRTEDAFVAIMEALKLGLPKRIDVAVPANLKGGLSEDEAAQAPETEAPWAPVTRTVTGVPEVDTAWVAASGLDLRLIDVRSEAEFGGELGHLAGSELAPLSEIDQRLGEWPTDEPVIVVCRSGGRSGRAARILEANGFRQVASMAGGMLKWHQERRPSER